MLGPSPPYGTFQHSENNKISITLVSLNYDYSAKIYQGQEIGIIVILRKSGMGVEK